MSDISKVSLDNGETEYNVKDATARAEISTLNGKIGANNGIATLNGSGKVPESQLPSYVDDVVEGYLYNGAFYTDSAHTTQITGESGKIYVDLTENKTYRWSGSTYVCVGGGGGDTSNCYQTTDAAETSIQNDDYFPFYDTSASAKKKSLWSSIKAALRTYFDGIYLTSTDIGRGTLRLYRDHGTSGAAVTFSANATADVGVDVFDEWIGPETAYSNSGLKKVAFSNLDDSYGYKIYGKDVKFRIVDWEKTDSLVGKNLIYTVEGDDVVVGTSKFYVRKLKGIPND